MINITVILILAGACILIGLLFGYMLGSLGKTRAHKQIPAPGEQLGMVEVVRFWSDVEGKKFMPEVDGRMISSLKDLNPDQQQRLTRLVDQLSQGVSPTIRATQPEVEIQENESISTEAIPTPPGVKAGEMLATPPPTPRPNFSLMSSLGRSLQPDIGNTPVQIKSIAAQIDEILQDRLEGTPLDQKGIRLMELPGKGMVVMVGLEQYPGVNDVPDPEVRAAIRAAVVEWENKVDSGSL